MAVGMSYKEDKAIVGDVRSEQEKFKEHQNYMKIYGGVLTMIGLAGLCLCIYHCKVTMPNNVGFAQPKVIGPDTNDVIGPGPGHQFGFRFY